jgi:hypothetical protein
MMDARGVPNGCRMRGRFDSDGDSPRDLVDPITCGEPRAPAVAGIAGTRKALG